MLMVMTLIGVTGMQNSSMEEKMVANVRDIDLSFQAAEAALREAETSLQVAVLKEFDGSNTGLYQPATRDNPPLWEVDTTWSSAGAVPYTGSLAYLSALPQYIIEELPPVPDPKGSVAADEPLPETRVYQGHGTGRGWHRQGHHHAAGGIQTLIRNIKTRPHCFEVAIMKTTFKLQAITSALLIGLAASAPAGAVSIADTPLFIGATVDPNIMLLVDTSGSMG